MCKKKKKATDFSVHVSNSILVLALWKETGAGKDSRCSTWHVAQVLRGGTDHRISVFESHHMPPNHRTLRNQIDRRTPPVAKDPRRGFFLTFRTPPCFRCVTTFSHCNVVTPAVDTPFLTSWRNTSLDGPCGNACCQPVGPCSDCCHCGPRRWNFQKKGAPHGQ